MGQLSKVMGVALTMALCANQALVAVEYPSIGSENLMTYSFTAEASTGDMIAYFAGSGGTVFSSNNLGCW